MGSIHSHRARGMVETTHTCSRVSVRQKIMTRAGLSCLACLVLFCFYFLLGLVFFFKFGISNCVKQLREEYEEQCV